MHNIHPSSLDSRLGAKTESKMRELYAPVTAASVDTSRLPPVELPINQEGLPEKQTGDHSFSHLSVNQLLTKVTHRWVKGDAFVRHDNCLIKFLVGDAG